jgi:hypothetical protein
MPNKEKKEDDSTGSFPLLNQLINSIEEAELKLEDAYYKKDLEQINSLKGFILQMQKRIAKEIT